MKGVEKVYLGGVGGVIDPCRGCHHSKRGKGGSGPERGND